MSALKYRHLSRSSSHRQALLRNLVTSLIEHETISTTYAKAKEAQRMAEKLITLGKRNTGAAKHQAQQIFYLPEKHIPKLFGPLRERYATRPGGYTRVLRQERREKDQAETAILCLVDGPKDVRWHMTALTLAHERATDAPMREMTMMNVRKVTRFREDGLEALEEQVLKIESERQAPKDEDAEEEEWEDVDDDLIITKEAREAKWAHQRQEDSQKIEAIKLKLAKATELTDKHKNRLERQLKDLEKTLEDTSKEKFPVALPQAIRVGGSRKRRRLAKRNARTNIRVEV
ncbi:uncharacterized protein A1O9_02800 [Exophiala aquamarina CBS 119918]|uniref:Large ribosomal subunit protein bL17m n=1 Tax=Exophiala aquamarina CBS 119918 TaxID=1182545 RepID=A0A072Q017_9EURO|nr:uncharacterized protein A1O9_02800 [Exophiala aquamarina CBS 119918]KEF61235.1 hypothetical protein A1O9_02800 [Exophiala aquamarina CBS 119918]